MAVSPTYPGVYVQEVPSGVRTIVGVGTSTALFIGRTQTGPMLKAIRINTYSDFVRTFGDDGGAVSATARYVRLFFLNGGSDCYVVRIANGWSKSLVTLESEATAANQMLVLQAKNPGALGDLLRATVNYNTATPDATFNLEVFRWEISVTGAKTKVEREELLNLSMDPNAPNFALTAITQRSKLVDAANGPNLPFPVNAGLPGRSLSGPYEAPEATFVTAWNTMLTTTDRFKVSIGGKKAVSVTLPALAAGPVVYATVRTALATAIQNAIAAAVTAEGVTGLPTPPALVTVVQGPTAVGATNETSIIRIAGNGNGLEVRVSSGDLRDIAKVLSMGIANGGIEVGAFASFRPAPTGITFKVTNGLDATGPLNTSSLVTYAGTNKDAFTSVTLDEIPASGVPQVRVVPFTPPLGGATRVWVDTTGGRNGVVETLGKLRDVINAFASANPTTFFWKAELWGHRLALLSTAGDDNAIVAGTGFAFAPAGVPATDMAARFYQNVRHLSVGPGSAGAGSQVAGASGSDGTAPLGSDYTAAYEVVRSDVDLWNLMVLPPDAAPAVAQETLWGEASAFCHAERAFLIMDPPGTWVDTQTASTGVNALRTGLTKDHSAVYFPRLKIVENGREHTVGPAGAMAGLYARIDANRGVWKAPAGSEADVRGVSGIDLQMSDLQNGAINPVGVNAIRLFPEGVISWGARTMDGADSFASEYKYVPIRRLALFIEESLYRGLKWVVFEPNDEPLWAQIRLNVGAFMHDLFRKGAFAGVKPSDAYFVRCDKETTTFNDQNLGIVNIWIGFAPLKPAEFVVLYLQQIAQKLAV
jgi:uncharacterized protein